MGWLAAKFGRSGRRSKRRLFYGQIRQEINTYDNLCAIPGCVDTISNCCKSWRVIYLFMMQKQLRILNHRYYLQECSMPVALLVDLQEEFARSFHQPI